MAERDESNISNASTVEGDIRSDDEAYTYLKDLNSDNLMQFSQQSALNELLKEHEVNVKPNVSNIQNLDILPTIEEHDIGGYKLQLNFRNWTYSEALNKIYIRMNEPVSFDVVYTPKFPLQQLRIRALITFIKEISEPVLRCQNHMSKDTETNPNKRQSLLRCENPSVTYCGHAQGKSVTDRFSVLIPLGTVATSKNDNTIKQTIAMKFTCQNSCIGRKETAIVFLLEGMNGEILSQRIVNIKICSCPKRDKVLDERNGQKTIKHKLNNEDEIVCSTPPKVRKKDTIKVEKSNSDIEENFCLEAVRTTNGRYRFVVEADNKDLLLLGLKTMTNELAGQAMQSKGGSSHQEKTYRKFKRLYDKMLNL